MNIPSVADVEHIAGIPDHTIRNLNITQCYYELSQGMKKLMGIHPNWCTCAVWASKQAGQSIRSEDLIRTFEYYFRHSPEVTFILESISQNIVALKNLPEIKSIRESILKVVDIESIFTESAEAVAEGNKKVFAEIGKEFARFLNSFREDEDFSSQNINTYCAALRSGDPPEGQQLLKDAFNAYCEARAIEDKKAKTELFFYANLLIGLHEQTRLQPEIVKALNLSFWDEEELRYKIFKQLLPGFWFKIRYFIARFFKVRLPLDKILDDILDLIKKQIREVITRHMMSLSIPGVPVLRLGSSLQIDFPEILLHLSNLKLQELLLKIDPTPDSLEESGAEDWGDFDDRIHFIADFFRSFHEHSYLFNTPFTDEQVLIIKANQKPSGQL
jgi:hypothetical protein